MKPIVVIADDLTGAADTGVCFTRSGLNVVIVFSPETISLVDVIVLSTESRNVGESEARKRIRRLFPMALEGEFIYKKIDSTLRGFPAPELDEILATSGIEKALIAPAFPAQGRTTIDGKQLVDGIAIEQTVFQDEGVTSDLIHLFGACDRPISSIPLSMIRSNPAGIQAKFDAPGSSLFIGDAETDADLRILAAAALRSGFHLFCGSAGLATALRHFFPVHEGSDLLSSLCKRKGAVLVVVGSRNPLTACQVKTARDSGVAVVELDPDAEGKQNKISDTVLKAITAIVTQHHDVILTISNSKEFPGGPTVAAERLAGYATYILSQHKIGGLIMTGGDISMAVISAFKASGVKLYGEFSPGIPVGILLEGLQPDLPIITKAGGFGNKDVLVKAIQFLRGG